MNTQSQGATAPTVFKFQETHQLRVIAIEGEPWFIAVDVCKVLDITNNRNAFARLDDDEKGVCLMDTLGGKQKASIINESGLYPLILGSRKPEAKPFKRWVTHEVLPAIRKTGRYTHPGLTFNDPPLANEPFQRIKAPLLAELRRMSKSLAQAYLVECGVTPEYVQQQLTALGDAIPPVALIYQDETPAEQRDAWGIACDEIRAAIKKAGKRGLTMRDMKRQAPFSKYTGLQLGKVLSYLEHDDGTIALVNVSSQRTAYVAIIKEAV
jgi:prophage antirepressor-like protein